MLTAQPQCLLDVNYFIFFPTRVHELFLYNDELKKSKFSFGHFISHKNSVTNKYDMKVRYMAVLYTCIQYTCIDEYLFIQSTRN